MANLLAFSGLLRQLRIDAGLTQEELADLAGLSTRAVSDLERGINVTARKETARLLATALGLGGEARTAFEAAARGRRSVQAMEPPGPAALATESSRLPFDPRRVEEPEDQVKQQPLDADGSLPAQSVRSGQATTGGFDSGPSGDFDGRKPRARLSRWHFPDGGPITLACQRLGPDRRSPTSDPKNPNYIRSSDMADLDTLIDVYGATSTYNPNSQITIAAAQDLTYQEAGNHLVLIGGLTWSTVAEWLTRILSIPLVLDDPYDRRAITIRDPDMGELIFEYVLHQDQVVEDVGVFACGVNPSAQHRTLTICGGITTRGVRGAARCFIDPGVREPNERYFTARFSEASFCCVVMKVPILNGDPLAPDLSKEETRLYEWRTPVPAISDHRPSG